MSVRTDISDKPLYYQGKFMPGNSLSSDTGISADALRPGVYGTLTAADAVSRGSSFHDDDYDRGVFNLPRYYPKYKSRKDSSRSNNSRRYRNDERTRDRRGTAQEFHGDGYFMSDPSYNEPVYAKPNKLKKSNANPTYNTSNEMFTVVDGFDTTSFEEANKKNKRRLTVVLIVIGVLVLCLIGVAIFLGIYLSQGRDNASTTPGIKNQTTTTKALPTTTMALTTTPGIKTILLQSNLKINARFDDKYNRLNATETVQLTTNLCAALNQSLANAAASRGATWGNNCAAVNYTAGSIKCVIQYSITASSTANTDDITNVINSTLNVAMAASYNSTGPFFSIFNSTVDHLGTEGLSPATALSASTPSPGVGSTVVTWTSPSSANVVSTANATLVSTAQTLVASTQPSTASTKSSTTSPTSANAASTSQSSTVPVSTDCATTSQVSATIALVSTTNATSNSAATTVATTAPISTQPSIASTKSPATSVNITSTPHSPTEEVSTASATSSKVSAAVVSESTSMGSSTVASPTVKESTALTTTVVSLVFTNANNATTTRATTSVSSTSKSATDSSNHVNASNIGSGQTATTLRLIATDSSSSAVIPTTRIVELSSSNSNRVTTQVTTFSTSNAENETDENETDLSPSASNITSSADANKTYASDSHNSTLSYKSTTVSPSIVETEAPDLPGSNDS